MTHVFKPGDEGLTRDGRRYRVTSRTNNPVFPLAGTMENIEGIEWPEAWTQNGRYQHVCDSGADLLPPKLSREVWVNLYENGITSKNPTRNGADDGAIDASPKRIARRRFTITEGEWDE